ncbi:hypothetical protein NUSPORA_01461 [Nucleospora cyclopteri]
MYKRKLEANQLCVKIMFRLKNNVFELHKNRFYKNFTSKTIFDKKRQKAHLTESIC